MRQRRRQGIPLGFGRGHTRTNGPRICPVVRIETLGPFRQLVSLLGATRPPGDPLHQLAVAPSQPRGFNSAERSAQHGLIVDHNGRDDTGWYDHGGRQSSGGGLLFLLLRPNLPPGPSRLVLLAVAIPIARHRNFPAERLPVEGHIRMGMLERHARLVIQRTAPDGHM